MRSSTAAQAAAILALVRTIVPRVSIGGSTTTWPVTEFSTNAQMKDTPDQISLLGGVAAAQATFKIDHTFVKQLSPYQPSIVPAASPLPIGTSVVVSVTIGTGSGASTYNLFTGYVTAIDPIDATSDITVTATDTSYLLGTNVSLPAVGLVPQAPGSFSYIDPVTADLYWSTLAVIELCLRRCGQYLTPAPVLSGAAWSQFTILSVSGYGGLLPDVGQLITPAASNIAGALSPVFGGNRVVGKFAPDVVIASLAQFNQTVSFSNVTDFQMWRCDTWVRGTGSSSFVLFTAATGSCGPGITDDGAGNAAVIWAGAPGGLVSTSGINLQDGAWHHLNVQLTRSTAGACTTSIEIDGSVTTGTATGITGSSFADGSVVSLATPLHGNQLWIEALEIIYVPTGATYTNPGSRNGQTPPLASAVTATNARLQAIAPQTGNGWQTIQDVASAEGALCWFDNGTFIFEPRTTWLARRIATSVRTFDASQITNLSMRVAADGTRKTVSANWQSVTAQASTAANPAYTGDAVLTFPPGYSVTSIQTDQRFFNPAGLGVGATNVTGHTWLYPVPAAAVGDPAAVPVASSSISGFVRPTSTGFDLVITNSNRFPVASWNPADGVIPQGPVLIVHGTRIITSDPQLVTAMGSPKATDDLMLDDNQWRQSLAITRQIVQSAACEVFSPIPVFDTVEVPGDSRLQLGDKVTLTAPHLQTPGGVPVIVVNMVETVNGGDDKQFRMPLGVKPIGAPTGWILGDPTRSVLGTSTYLPYPG